MLFVPRQKGLGKDSFLKLADKEEITGIFRGEIYTYRHHWTGSGGLECSGEGCPACAEPAPAGEKKRYPAFRFRVNFVTSKDGKWVSKIFETGGEVYDQLSNLDKKFDLSKTVVEITRNGEKKNTKYTIIPRVDQPITKEMEAKINAVPLLPLSLEMNEPGSDG